MELALRKPYNYNSPLNHLSCVEGICQKFKAAI